MDSKDKLLAVLNGTRDVEADSEELARLRLLYEKISKAYSSDAEVVLENEAELARKEQELTDKVEALKKSYAKAIAMVKKIKVVTKNKENQTLTMICQDILIKRYLKGQPWQSIACEEGYSLRQIHRLHSLALQTLEHRSN